MVGHGEREDGVDAVPRPVAGARGGAAFERKRAVPTILPYVSRDMRSKN